MSEMKKPEAEILLDKQLELASKAKKSNIQRRPRRSGAENSLSTSKQKKTLFHTSIIILFPSKPKQEIP